MRSLQVDAFARRVSRQKDCYIGILREPLLCSPPVFACHSAVDGDDSLVATENAAELRSKIVQRVAVLGEDDQLLTRRWRRRRNRARAIRRRRAFGDLMDDCRGSDDLAEETR